MTDNTGTYTEDTGTDKTLPLVLESVKRVTGLSFVWKDDHYESAPGEVESAIVDPSVEGEYEVWPMAVCIEVTRYSPSGYTVCLDVVGIIEDSSLDKVIRDSLESPHVVPMWYGIFKQKGEVVVTKDMMA